MMIAVRATILRYMNCQESGPLLSDYTMPMIWFENLFILQQLNSVQYFISLPPGNIGRESSVFLIFLGSIKMKHCLQIAKARLVLVQVQQFITKAYWVYFTYLSYLVIFKYKKSILFKLLYTDYYVSHQNLP